METTRVVTTYKNGKLVSNKKFVERETKPIYPDSLAATQALQHSLNKTLGAFDEMASELYALRRQLIEAKREVKARTKERNSLRRAYLEQGKDLKRLERQKEDLRAKLFAAAEDLRHLEEAAAKAAEAKHKQKPKPKQEKTKPKQEKTTSARVNPTNFKLEENTKTETKPRSIAASPVKR